MFRLLGEDLSLPLLSTFSTENTGCQAARHSLSLDAVIQIPRARLERFPRIQNTSNLAGIRLTSQAQPYPLSSARVDRRIHAPPLPGDLRDRPSVNQGFRRSETWLVHTGPRSRGLQRAVDVRWSFRWIRAFAPTSALPERGRAPGG